MKKKQGVQIGREKARKNVKRNLECCKCERNVSQAGHLKRINEKNVRGLWACTDCLKIESELIERDTENENEALYVHAENCGSFCDFACNGGWGELLAEYVNITERRENKSSKCEQPESENEQLGKGAKHKCDICGEPIENINDLVILASGHLFHEKCTDQSGREEKA